MAKKFSEMSTVAQLGVIAGVTLVLVGVGEYVWLNSLRTGNDELKTRVQTLQADNASIRPFEDKVKQIQSDIKQLENQLATLKAIVPEEKEADAFIKMVQEAGLQSGVNIRMFNARPTQTKEFYNEMPFEINIDGNYYTVLQFFDRLSRLSRIINVTNLSVGPPSGGVRGVRRRYIMTPNETVISAFTATTFYSRESGTAAAKR